MKELAQALKSRGFLIKQEDDHIYFSMGNSERELSELENVFDELGCDVMIKDRKIYINKPLERKQLDEIAWYPARNHEAGGGPGWRTWKYFSKRQHGPKVNTFSLETGIAFLVKALSAAGIVTISSCDGHGRRSPHIVFCGHHNAIWFNILFREIEEKMNLTYDWKIEERNNIDLPLRAISSTGKWDLQQVLDDTSKIADFFLENAEDLSRLKRETFGGKLRSTRKIVKPMNYGQLYEWMEAKFKKNKENLDIFQ